MNTVSRILNHSIGLWSFLWSSLPNPDKKSITHQSHVVPAFWRLFFWWHAWLGHDNAPNRATFFVQKKGFRSAPPFRQQPTDRPSTRVTTMKSKSYVFCTKQGVSLSTAFQTATNWSFIFNFYPKGTQNTNFHQKTHPSKNILTKNCCSGATYRMDSQICISFGFVIPIFIYKMINNKIPAQFKSPFLDRNSIL